MFFVHFVVAAVPSTIPSGGNASKSSFSLPAFSWDILPRFVHCGPSEKHFPTAEDHAQLYKELAAFPLVTLEKFTWQADEPANLHEEAKILEAAAEIRKEGTDAKIIFYHMAWQDFAQFDLYNLTYAHAKDGWAVAWDNGTIPGYDGAAGKMTYNHSNPDMRHAWVASLRRAMDTGNVDGFFIDITPQALPNITDPTDPVDGMLPYAENVQQICRYCNADRQAALLDGLRLVLEELAAECPGAIIICNPVDYGACNTEFFEYFGSSADHGRSVVGDFAILQRKYAHGNGHLVQARAATQNDSTAFHVGEFLIGAGDYSYFGASTGWGCQDGWLDEGVPGDRNFWKHPLGVPTGPYEAKPNGAVPWTPPPGKPNSSTPGMVYRRSFGGNAGKGGGASADGGEATEPSLSVGKWQDAEDVGAMTKVWLNLTDGNLWKHAHACVRPGHAWPAIPTCPQMCIWWSDNVTTAFPPGFNCDNQSALFDDGW